MVIINNKRFMIALLILILIFPLPVSYILEWISSLPCFPLFLKDRFFEEYYKLLGTFVLMIAGFWYANELIEKRISKERHTELEIFRTFLSNLKTSINELIDACKKNVNEINDAKKTFEFVYEQLISSYGNSINVKNTISSHGIYLLKELEKVKGKIYTKMPNHPIDINKLIKMKEVLSELEKEV